MHRTGRHSARILFAAGGTGGHVYPAIAIADAVRQIDGDAAIAFVGTEDRMEWSAVPRAGFPIHAIQAAAIARRLTVANLAIPAKVLSGIRESRSIIRGFEPDVVVGTGGYVTGPVILAASFLDVPIVLQEQNAFPGKTNKWLASRADEIHIAFPEAEAYFPRGRCVLSGNPTRAALLSATRDEARTSLGVGADEKMLLVFGGSLGSAALNAFMSANVSRIVAGDTTKVLWQTGKLYFDRYKDFASLHPSLSVVPYIDRMDRSLAAADLVVARAGAITCSELMVTGTASVLVPSPNVAEDHQTWNARSMVEAGAAVLVPEAEMSASLVPTVTSLLGDDDRRELIGMAARKAARPNAAAAIAESIMSLALSMTNGAAA